MTTIPIPQLERLEQDIIETLKETRALLKCGSPSLIVTIHGHNESISCRIGDVDKARFCPTLRESLESQKTQKEYLLEKIAELNRQLEALNK
jgi:hypothetical protein